MRRKGDSTMMGVIIVVILGLFFLASSTFWVQKLFGARLDEEAINNACRQSVILNNLKRGPLDTEIAKTKCSTKYITFHEFEGEQEFESNPLNPRSQEKVELPKFKYKDKDGKECESSEDKKACTFRGINNKIANEMERCWTNFNKGNGRVFSIYKGVNRQCIICSVFLFDSEMVEKYGPDGDIGFSHSGDPNYDLDAYMKSNNNLYYSKDSYYEDTLDFIDRNVELPYYDYDVSQEFAIVFVALNKDAKALITKEIWDRFLESIGEEGSEDEGNFINTLEFIPNKEVNTICDVWA